MTHFSPPSRKAYLLEQQRNHKRQLFGVFPSQYPREILWALNILPVEIWDPPLDIRHADAHLQPHICSIVKYGLELIIQGQGEVLDGFLFPHTCDSIQNMASIVNDYLGIQKPCYFFYHPKAPYTEASRTYYKDQLLHLISRIEKQVGPMDPSALSMAMSKGSEMMSLFHDLYRLRAQGELNVSNEQFYQFVRQVEYRHPDDFIPLLREYIHEYKGERGEGPVVVLSGVLPNPVEILTILDHANVRIGHDDLLCCSRRLTAPVAHEGDPFEILSKQYFDMPPCTTKASSVSERLDRLMTMIEQCRAKGVIFSMIRFCEPELFDLPPLLDAFKSKGIATLVIDTEINQGISGPLRTRLEAFVELLQS
jgi:benzoyl-CoA reductase/2-hydroxyglutaryl-CoA dehydratase subunit BcrC/BadD/HgdB